MSQYEKALARLLSRPKNFTWRELQRIMTHLGYVEKTGSGSKREFVHVETDASLKLHEPHPHNILKEYAIKDIVHFLQEKHHI